MLSRPTRFLLLLPFLVCATALAGKGGVENAEIKVTIRADQIAAATTRFALSKAGAEHRFVTFYDTPALTLFKSGIILRTRKLLSGQDDSTVKLRPIDPSRIAASWFALSGFKCEEDWSAGAAVTACSLSHEQKKSEIDEVAAGKRAIEKLFSANQESFLSTYANQPTDYLKLKPLGPAEAWVWQLRRPDYDHKLTIERWELPSGTALLEISIRVPIATAAVAQRSFFAYLEGSGLDTKSRDDSKTRAALEFFTKP